MEAHPDQCHRYILLKFLKVITSSMALPYVIYCYITAKRITTPNSAIFTHMHNGIGEREGFARLKSWIINFASQIAIFSSIRKTSDFEVPIPAGNRSF